MSVHLTLGPLARARNGVIGRGAGLPWRLSTDLKRFRALTIGKPVIMGRKTWDSLPRRPLVGRANLVVSRDAALVLDGAVVCDGFDRAVALGLARAAEAGASEVCVIGGASLFALARADRIYLTDVDADVAGDVRLPALDERGWREVRRAAHPASAHDDHPFTIRVLERR